MPLMKLWIRALIAPQLAVGVRHGLFRFVTEFAHDQKNILRDKSEIDIFARMQLTLFRSK